jgi:tetratricopeptide (TPR) repeat protein
MITTIQELEQQIEKRHFVEAEQTIDEMLFTLSLPPEQLLKINLCSALVFNKLGKYEQAEEQAMKGIASPVPMSHQSLAELYQELAISLMHQKNVEEAEPILEEACLFTELSVDLRADLYRRYAFCLAILGKNDAATEYAKKAHTEFLNPNYFAGIRCSPAEAADQMSHNLMDIQCIQATILNQQQKHRSALTMAINALDTRPDVASKIRDNLLCQVALAHTQLGHPALAHYHLRRISDPLNIVHQTPEIEELLQKV